jgi:hypothetical protein
MKSAVVKLVTDPDTGDLVLPLDDEIFSETGWDVGDTLEWLDQKDGSWVLRKKEISQEKEWVMVEAISTFRERYMIEVPKGKADWALDNVTLGEAKEFSQKHLGETIVSHRVISEEEALELCNKDNDYCKTWNKENKMNAFFTRDGEKRDY